MQLTWEQAVEWARRTPEMAGLVDVCYYDDPIEIAAARFKAGEEWRAITAFLPLRPGCKVLEIGAGRGIMSWAFASEGCEVHALEPDPSALVGAGAIRQLCARTGQRINILETVGERLAFADATFDYAVCRGMLQRAIAARASTAVGVRIAGSDMALHLYRRWLTLRCRVPGRLHSFLADKPA